MILVFIGVGSGYFKGKVGKNIKSGNSEHTVPVASVQTFPESYIKFNPD
jgi:hypothetical protein